MGKLKCSCGHIIVDQTDKIPYKGYILPDVNVEDISTFIENKIDGLVDAIKSNNKEKWIKVNFGAGYPRDLQASSMINDLISGKIIDLTQDIFECENCGRIAIEVGQENKFRFFSPDSNDQKNILHRKNKIR